MPMVFDIVVRKITAQSQGMVREKLRKTPTKSYDLKTIVHVNNTWT